MKKIAAALFLFISMAVMALPASADPLIPGYTVDFNNVGGAQAGGEYIYPYLFTVTNNVTLASSSVSMMCIDFTREIAIPETWQATLIQVSSDNTNVGTTGTNADPSDQDLRALAILDSEEIAASAPGYTGPGTAAEYQYAAWSILDPGLSNASFDLAAQGYAAAALTEALGSDNGFQYQDYSYFNPEDGSEDPNNYGDPQRFMLYTPSVGTPHVVPSVPEPSSLMLLGTGVLGLASVARRRFVKA